MNIGFADVVKSSARIIHTVRPTSVREMLLARFNSQKQNGFVFDRYNTTTINFDEDLIFIRKSDNFTEFIDRFFNDFPTAAVMAELNN